MYTEYGYTDSNGTIHTHIAAHTNYRTGPLWGEYGDCNYVDIILCKPRRKHILEKTATAESMTESINLPYCVLLPGTQGTYQNMDATICFHVERIEDRTTIITAGLLLLLF